MGAMTVLIRGIIVVVRKVPSSKIIHESVRVIIPSVSGFPGVLPDVRGKIGVIGGDSRIDDSHDHIGRTCGHFPG